jgi:CRP-like cAMP-binding protein
MYDFKEKPICGCDTAIASRRLCITHYNHHYLNGTLDQYPPINHKLADVIAEYLPLHQCGTTKTAIANAIGMTPRALNTALNRALAQGLITEDQR